MKTSNTIAIITDEELDEKELKNIFKVDIKIVKTNSDEGKKISEKLNLTGYPVIVSITKKDNSHKYCILGPGLKPIRCVVDENVEKK